MLQWEFGRALGLGAVISLAAAYVSRCRLVFTPHERAARRHPYLAVRSCDITGRQRRSAGDDKSGNHDKMQDKFHNTLLRCDRFFVKKCFVFGKKITK